MAYKSLGKTAEWIKATLNAVAGKADKTELPSKTSDLTNDSGYLTQHQSIKTINGQSMVGSGNVVVGGDDRVKEEVHALKTGIAADAIDNNKDALRQLQWQYNSVNFGSDSNFVPLCDCMQSGDNFGHVAAMVIKDGVVYVTYYTSTEPGITEEGSGKLSIRLITFPLATPTTQTAYWVAKYGESITIDGVTKQIADTFDPSIVEVNGIIYVYFIVQYVGDGGRYSVVGKFNPTSKTFEYQSLKFWKGGQSCAAEGNAINTLVGDNVLGTVGIAIQPTFSLYNGEYYNGWASVTAKSLLVKTTDFINFYYVSHPDFIDSSQNSIEASVYVSHGIVYYACRRLENYVSLDYYDIANDKWIRGQVYADCMTRPAFIPKISANGSFYFVTQPTDRSCMDFVQIATGGFNYGSVMRARGVSQSYFYPNFYIYNSNIYMVWSNGRRNVYFTKITIPSVYTDNVSTRFKQLYNSTLTDMVVTFEDETTATFKLW